MARNFGQNTLESFLQSSTNLQPADFVDQLFRKISASLQQDDLTVVLAQFD